MAAKVFATAASVVSIGFGLWHFFVPRAWQWYSYIAKEATELVAAVRAINVFFSLCLVLIGAVNIVFAYAPKSSAFAFQVMMAVSVVLWLVRVVMQLVFPQGSINPWLQYGMLSAFVMTFLCFLTAFVLSVK